MRSKEDIQSDIKRIEKEMEYHEREVSVRKNDLYWLKAELKEAVD